jgi:predicted lysophospholipase L1 biosynthesis ABC-type transport system permease subunit
MRAREIAVRMALGARADRVVALVLRQALTIATIGSVLGALVGIAAGFVIRAEVFGVAGVDIAALSGSAALLAAAMILASSLPGWRTARLDPNAVLRQEQESMAGAHRALNTTADAAYSRSIAIVSASGLQGFLSEVSAHIGEW